MLPNIFTMGVAIQVARPLGRKNVEVYDCTPRLPQSGLASCEVSTIARKIATIRPS